MIITWDGDSILNTEPDGDKSDPNWWPEDTRLSQRGSRVIVARRQAQGWEQRAAREWVAGEWQRTGADPQETELEIAIRVLRENPLDPLPDVDVPELPASPTSAEVVEQVRTHRLYIQRMADEVVLHRRYVEGYRKIILRLLRAINRSDFFRQDPPSPS